MPVIAPDLTGRKFGRLTAIERTRRSGQLAYRCSCECGGENVVTQSNLVRGRTLSCGCLYLETHTKHGHARRSGKSSEHVIWTAMVHRCENSADPQFKDYGGRGIVVCARWREPERGFANFLADMGPRPKGLTLDRRDNDVGYSPENCRWATRSEQQRNTRRSHNLTIDDETQPLVEWAARSGRPYNTIIQRLNRGLDAKQAVFGPPG